MSFMDGIRKLTQPYDDEDDTFGGADTSLRKPPKPSPAAAPAEGGFEDDPEAAVPREASKSGGFWSNFGSKKPPKQSRASLGERVVNFGGNEFQVILFNPKTFDEAGELANHLNMGRSVLVSLEGNTPEMTRRLMDFLSGIAFALQGKLTPVGGKTYFASPANVELLDPNKLQPETGGQRL